MTYAEAIAELRAMNFQIITGRHEDTLLAGRMVAAIEAERNRLLDLVDYLYVHVQEAQYPTGEQTTGEILQEMIDTIQSRVERQKDSESP